MRLILAIFILSLTGHATAQIIQKDYTGFTVWVDCAKRGPIMFHYMATTDGGSLARKGNYYLDPNTSPDCQSTENDPFQGWVPAGEPAYDVGHQVPANHLDHDAVAIKEANYWTNLLPQTLSMNRGAWVQTEHLIECIRDQVDLEIWGGTIWGNDTSNDHFVQSHGMETPDEFWKVVIRQDNKEANAWIIPNGRAPGSDLDSFLVSVAHVEGITGRVFDAANKTVTPSKSWSRPEGCDIE